MICWETRASSRNAEELQKHPQESEWMLKMDVNWILKESWKNPGEKIKRSKLSGVLFNSNIWFGHLWRPWRPWRPWRGYHLSNFRFGWLSGHQDASASGLYLVTVQFSTGHCHWSVSGLQNLFISRLHVTVVDYTTQLAQLNRIKSGAGRNTAVFS